MIWEIIETAFLLSTWAFAFTFIALDGKRWRVEGEAYGTQEERNAAGENS